MAIVEEVGERRACVKRNSDEQTMSRKHDRSHALERVRQRAKTGQESPTFLA
jgi:hypothetical protein